MCIFMIAEKDQMIVYSKVKNDKIYPLKEDTIDGNTFFYLQYSRFWTNTASTCRDKLNYFSQGLALKCKL
jgi:hypothetical protein